MKPVEMLLGMTFAILAILAVVATHDRIEVVADTLETAEVAPPD